MSARVTPVRDISQPLLLLRTDVRSGGNPVGRIDEEEHQDFAVARLLWVDKLERLDLVLVYIGECDAAIAFGDHVSDFLYTG